MTDDPIRTRRGLAVRTFEIDTYYFARAPVERVAGLVAEAAGSWSWRRDVYGARCRLPGRVFYQFRGHPWTGAVDLGEAPGSFSARLGGAVFVYGYEGVFGSISYWHFESGQLVERFERGPDPDREGEDLVRFESRLRDVGPIDPGRVFEFIDATCRWLDLYAEAPPLSAFDEGEDSFLLLDPRFGRDDYERVDWVGE